MTIELDYRLVGTGWCRCTVALDGKRIEITGSYLSDCLGELADATLGLLAGATRARASFEEEPGEYRWILEREDRQVRLRILEFPDFADLPDSEGKLLLDGGCELTRFAGAVRGAMERLLDEHGMDGYLERWVDHEFPLAQLQAIRAHGSATREPGIQ